MSQFFLSKNHTDLDGSLKVEMREVNIAKKNIINCMFQVDYMIFFYLIISFRCFDFDIDFTFNLGFFVKLGVFGGTTIGSRSLFLMGLSEGT